MKKIKVILSVLLMAAAISFTACSNASSGSSDPSTPAPATTPSTPSSGGSGGGSQTPAVTYIGSKAPTVAKAVGDVVFTDGSATPYTPGMSFTDTQKNAAVAIIFYVGNELNNTGDTTTVRTLGLGLKHDKTGRKWCSSTTVKGYNTNISTIRSDINTDGEGNVTITGDKNGFDNLIHIAIALAGNNDTDTETNYPAFYFGKKYKDITGSHVSNTIYENGWYLPSLAELYYIYLKGKSDSKSFDIDAALQALDGDKFEENVYWTSTQQGASEYASIFNFSNGNSEGSSNKTGSNKVCAIRDFTNYTITINSATNGTVTANKTSAQAGDSITLTGTGTPTEANDYKVASFTVNTNTISPVTNNTYTFTMPAANVTVSATFEAIVYKGTKRPSATKAVGDVVFKDGSAMPYTTLEGHTNKTSLQSEAIAVIYKVDGTKAYGVGLVQKCDDGSQDLSWCINYQVKGYDIDIPEITTRVNSSTTPYTFTGDIDGSNNFIKLKEALGVNDDTGNLDNYPVFKFAINYKDEANSHVSGTAYESGWYLPAIAELYDLYQVKTIVQDAITACGRSSYFNNNCRYWSSSQVSGNKNKVWRLDFNTSQNICESADKINIRGAVCCIRQF